jgi:TrmH family RNA methyltransferase
LIEYKNKNFTIIGADQNGIPYSEDMINRKNRWVLVLGSESHGISPKNYSLLTHTVSITKIGTGESLNMAIAGGILLHQLTLFSNKKEKS